VRQVESNAINKLKGLMAAAWRGELPDWVDCRRGAWSQNPHGCDFMFRTLVCV